MKTLTFVYGEDKQGIYVDGVLEVENIELALNDVFDVLENNGIKVKLKEIDDDWLEDVNHKLPTDIKKVRFFE